MYEARINAISRKTETSCGWTAVNMIYRRADQNPIHARFITRNFEIRLRLILAFADFDQIIPFIMLAMNIIATINRKKESLIMRLKSAIWPASLWAAWSLTALISGGRLNACIFALIRWNQKII